MNVELVLNGRAAVLEARSDEMLLAALRRAGMLSVRETCAIGMCGACTVLLDGEPVCSCLVLAVQAHGHEVETVESLIGEDRLHPLQESFRRRHGLQCGFCTPGILMSVVGAARAGETLEDTLEAVLGGHLCRCTGYVNIRAAIRDAWPEIAAP